MSLLIRKGQRQALTVKASTDAELEIDLKGTFQPGCEAWGGSRFERPINPPEHDRIEDAEITGIYINVATYNYQEHRNIYKRFDLLAGVDLTSPIVDRIKQNLMEHIRAESALLDEVEEDDQ